MRRTRGKQKALVSQNAVEQKQSDQEALLETEAQYRGVFEATTDGLVINDWDGNVVEVNPAFARMHGYTREEMVGMPPPAFIHPDSHAKLQAFFETVRSGKEFQTQADDVRKDGTSFPVEVNGTTFTYRGKPHILGIVRDITERVEAYKLLRMKDDQYRAIFEATSDGLVIADLDGNVKEVNPAFASALGYTPEELVGMDPRKWIHPSSHPNLEEYLARVRAGERFHSEGLQVRKDGSVFPADVNESPFTYNGQRHTLAIIRDVTERVRSRELLEQRVEERTRELATLLEVSSNVASTLELKPLLQRILDQLKLVTDYRRATVAVNEPDEVMMLNSWGDNSITTPAPGRSLPVDSFGPIGASIRRGQPVIIPDVLGESAYAEIMRERTTAAMANDPLVTETLEERLLAERCIMYVPMMLKGKMVGGLILRHSEPDYYKQSHADLAMAIAHQAAIAIENARLYREAQETTRKTAALAQIASQVAFGGALSSTLQVLCRHIVDVTGAVASAVVLHDPQTGKTEMAGTHGLPDGYASALNKILASGVPLLVQQAFDGGPPALRRGMRQAILSSPSYAPLHPLIRDVPWDSVVAVPMTAQGSPVGVLFSYHLPTQDIGDAQLTFHTLLADQAAVAVQNAHLLTEAHDKARLEERQRLARELHDSVTQALFSISLIARSTEVVLQREGKHSDEVMEKLADLRHLTQGALAEMRALIFELRPGALEEEGLVEALRKHTAAVQGREMLQIDVIVSCSEPDLAGQIPRLKPVAEEALYRIAQEAMHNVAKHARATHVEVCLEVENGSLTMRVKDNGTGFDRDKTPPGHMGLGTMRQRTELLNGEFTIETQPGKGTTIVVCIQLRQWQL